MGDVGIACTVAETKFGEGMFGDLFGGMVNVLCVLTDTQKAHKMVSRMSFKKSEVMNPVHRMIVRSPIRDGSGGAYTEMYGSQRSAADNLRAR